MTRVLITAGPTYEKIDPVRFIGNFSSGKMGFALVDACIDQGWEVELVLGPVTIPTQKAEKWAKTGVHVTNVVSAQQMYDVCINLFPSVTMGILCAAVADYTPRSVSPIKIKRKDDMVLRLKPTKDIAKALGQMKAEGQKLIGFALETNDEAQHAKDKLRKKRFDFIVLNSLRDDGAGFRYDTNKITIISDKESIEYPLMTKTECAEEIVKKLKKI